MGLLFFYAFISIFFSFLCSILEASLLSFTPSFLKIKIKEKRNYAIALAEYKKDIDIPLIAILTVNTVAHTVGAILVGVQAEKTFGDGTNTVGIISVIMTAAILVLSEIIPKTIGATYWQSLGSFTAIGLKFLIIPLKYSGVLWLLMFTTKLIGKSAHVSTMSREEFLAITDAAREDGVFEKNETTIIKNLLLFNAVKARDIMTPFSVAKIENEEKTIEEFYQENRNLRFSRIPVYHGNPNEITGFILKDDVLEQMVDEKGPEPLKILKRKILITSADSPIPKLFENLIGTRDHISMVVDEYGNTMGIVTIEDIIETLLGLEIMDELDNIEDMQILARMNWEKRAKKIGIFNIDSDNSRSSDNS